MEGYQRFFVIGLLLVGLVGIYAENRRGPVSGNSNDRQGDGSEISNGEFRETLLTIEDAAAAQPPSDASKIIEKRSNPSGSGGGMSKDDLDWHFEEGRRVLARESVATTAQKMALRRANQRAQQNQAKPTTRTKTTQTSPKGRS